MGKSQYNSPVPCLGLAALCYHSLKLMLPLRSLAISSVALRAVAVQDDPQHMLVILTCSLEAAGEAGVGCTHPRQHGLGLEPREVCDGLLKVKLLILDRFSEGKCLGF